MICFCCGKYVTTLPSLLAIWIVVVKIWCFQWLKVVISDFFMLIDHYGLSLKHMTCRSHTHEISACRHWCDSISNEGLPISVSHACNNEWSKLHKKCVPFRPEIVTKTKKRRKKTERVTAKHFALYANAKSQAKAFCINTQIFKRSLFLCYRNVLLGSSPFLTTNTTRGCYQTYPNEYCVKITPFGN